MRCVDQRYREASDSQNSSSAQRDIDASDSPIPNEEHQQNGGKEPAEIEAKER
jgi:hypothetical protein